MLVGLLAPRECSRGSAMTTRTLSGGVEGRQLPCFLAAKAPKEERRKRGTEEGFFKILLHVHVRTSVLYTKESREQKAYRLYSRSIFCTVRTCVLVVRTSVLATSSTYKLREMTFVTEPISSTVMRFILRRVFPSLTIFHLLAGPDLSFSPLVVVLLFVLLVCLASSPFENSSWEIAAAHVETDSCWSGGWVDSELIQ